MELAGTQKAGNLSCQGLALHFHVESVVMGNDS